MKKILSAVACLLLVITFTSCGGDSPTTITVWFMGGSVADDADVIDAANARLQELGLNIEIEPIWTGGWSMGYPAQTALDTGDTDIDIYWTGSWGLNFWANAAVGNFIRLDDPSNNLLATYGQGMRNAVPTALWDTFTTQGPSGVGIYGIPGYKDYAMMYTWDVNNTRLAELGFDFYSLFDPNGFNYDVLFDPQFEAAMVAAQEMWGDTFFPFAPENELFARALSNADFDLTDTHAFHFGFDPRNPALPANPTIGLKLENDLYVRVLERLHHFWNMGFIDPRLAISEQASSVLVEQRNSGEYLFSSIVYAYGHTGAASNERGIDARFPRISQAFVSTTSAAGSGFAVSVYSQNQSESVQFMNAWYTDSKLATILTYGVEGTHFTRNADGTITRAEDATAVYNPWRFGMGNIFILPPTDVDGVGYFERFQAYNAEGVGTALVGFVFDSSPVSTQLAAITGVRDQFHGTLTVGAVDPAVTIPQYLAQLRASGVDDVAEELNRQIQVFLANR
ncbi:MAG: ABC transporter substrate-binding protein [Defluviitaleaceae bacterium]|nr:ABC transporter substrate-binding protein [Defluviitaleaceae bacterium]